MGQVKDRRLFFRAVFDKRLYGAAFFAQSGILLAIGFSVQFIVSYVMNRVTLIFYVPLFVVLVLVSGLASKNYVRGREAPNMGWFRSFLFLIASILASIVPFYMKYSNDLYGSIQYLFLISITSLAVLVAILEVTVLGHRNSLRASLGLNDKFFSKGKKRWKEELQDFPGADRILEKIDDGKFLSVFFERGSFDVTILWCCNTMEEIIDAIADGIIQIDSSKRALFKKPQGGPQRYPSQLAKLDFVSKKKSERREEQVTVDELWDEVRNRIAHHKHKPTFSQTYGALLIFACFVEDFPKTFHDWRQTNLVQQS